MIRRNGNRILDDNFKTDVQIAEFSDDNWTKKAKSDFVTDHNFGKRMLEIYENHRDSMHISNVVKMLKEMEENWQKYSMEKFNNQRKS